MNSKTKILTVMLASIAASILIVLPLTNAIQPSVSLGDELTAAEIECESVGCRAGLKVRFVWWFLNHSEPTEVDGTVVALTEKKLILNTDDDQIRVNLPAE